MKHLLFLFFIAIFNISSIKCQALLTLENCQKATYIKLSDVENWLYKNGFHYDSSEKISDITYYAFFQEYDYGTEFQLAMIYDNHKGFSIAFSSPQPKVSQLEELKKKGFRELTNAEIEKMDQLEKLMDEKLGNPDPNAKIGIRESVIIDGGYVVSSKAVAFEDGIVLYTIFIGHPSLLD